MTPEEQKQIANDYPLRAGEYIDWTINDYIPQFGTPPFYMVGPEEPQSDKLTVMKSYWWDTKENVVKVLMSVAKMVQGNPVSTMKWNVAANNYPKYVLNDEGAIVGMVRVNHEVKSAMKDLDDQVSKLSFKELMAQKVKKK